MSPRSSAWLTWHRSRNGQKASPEPNMVSAMFDFCLFPLPLPCLVFPPRTGYTVCCLHFAVPNEKARPFSGSFHKTPQTEWLINNDIHFSQFWRPGRPWSGCQCGPVCLHMVDGFRELCEASLFFFFFLILFIYLWLCWVFVSVRGLPLAAASRGHSSSRCAGLSLPRPLPLRSTGSGCAGSVVVAHGPSCSAACGIFPDPGPNPRPPHRQADSQPLRH